MNIGEITYFFVSKSRIKSGEELRATKLVIRGSLLTSLFSSSYLILSILFDFEIGVILMAFNVVGFLLLPFLFRTSASSSFIGNLYVLIGAIAVIVLSVASGGIYSAIYPWIISIPILALLIVSRKSALVWGVLSFLIMVLMGILTIWGFEFPNYFTADQNVWITMVQPGLLLITFVIAYIFQQTQRQALTKLGNQNSILIEQKNIIASQKEELNVLIDDKNYIIRILAHDIRSPLKNIQGLIKLLELETDPDRKEEIQELLLQTSLNAENLVNRVLEMDRSEHDNTKSNISRININMLLLELVNNMQELANKKHISIAFNDEKGNWTVEADKTYIHLIFENLLSNAIKFSDEGKIIEVNVIKLDDHIRVSVIDQGQGIHPQEENKLFKKFSKLSTRPTAGETSTGLGLSLVKRYVELSNGKVWYDRNHSRKGSTFIVELPLSS